MWLGAPCADVGSMVHVIGQWMLGLLTPSTDEDRMDRSDEDAAMVGGLSRLVAEILAKLEAGMGGAPLDVEISYEMEDDVRSQPSSPPWSNLCMRHLSAALSLVHVMCSLGFATSPSIGGNAPAAMSPFWRRIHCEDVGPSLLTQCVQESLSAGETEIDIEIDPELAPALTAQFLDERLLALSRNLNRCARRLSSFVASASSWGAQWISGNVPTG